MKKLKVVLGVVAVSLCFSSSMLVADDAVPAVVDVVSEVTPTFIAKVLDRLPSLEIEKLRKLGDDIWKILKDGKENKGKLIQDLLSSRKSQVNLAVLGLFVAAYGFDRFFNDGAITDLAIEYAIIAGKGSINTANKAKDKVVAGAKVAKDKVVLGAKKAKEHVVIGVQKVQKHIPLINR